MNLKSKITKFASSPQGRKLTDKAKTLANDPKTKDKIENAKRKLASRKAGKGGQDRAA